MKGGKRPGAGRKKGSKNVRTREVAMNAAKAGITPLEHMLAVMRDPKAGSDRRDDMARAAAPYVHPRLNAVEHTGKDGGPIKTESTDPMDLARWMAFTIRQAAERKANGRS